MSLTQTPKLMKPTEVTRRLQSLLHPLSDKGAHSTLIVYDKALTVVLQSLGRNVRMRLYIRGGAEGRIYGDKLDLEVLGREPRSDWLKKYHKVNFENVVLLESVVKKWGEYHTLVERHNKKQHLGSMLEAFELIATTLVKCRVCVGLIVPIKDLRIRPEDAEIRLAV